MALSRAIEAARRAVHDTQYADVHALVRLACLELHRDGDVADGDGASDAARSVKDAMRAVAVQETSSEAHLALALGVARALRRTLASDNPTMRELALELVEMALRGAPPAAGAAGAARRTLEGYLAMDRGQPGLAGASFEVATQLDAKLGSAWAGFGDLARSRSDFDGARAAYARAASLLPADEGLARAFAATARKEILLLPGGSATAEPPITSWPLAPAPPPLPSCPASSADGTSGLEPPAAAPVGASLCLGLGWLARASSRADQEQAATLIVEGWREMRPLCVAHDTACGPHVAEAVAAAARAYQAAGRTAKALATARIAADGTTLPGAAAIAPTVALEIGDRYFALGMFELAADWYARHAGLGGIHLVGPAVDRALAIYAAFARMDAATKLADEMARDPLYSAAQRARWVVSAAAIVRTVEGSREAATWLRPHRPLLEAAGAGNAADDPSMPRQEAESSSAGAAPLWDAVKRLAGEGWCQRPAPSTTY